MRFQVYFLLLATLGLVLSGCASRYSHGELRYANASSLPYNPTFEDVRALPAPKVLYCDGRKVERFLDGLDLRNHPADAPPPPGTADGAVFLAVKRDDPGLGAIIDCWVTADGQGGEIHYVGRPRRNDDGTTKLIGTWFYWTPELVDAWNDMLETATPHKPE